MIVKRLTLHTLGLLKHRLDKE